MADELSELIDDPVERMEVEYKAWLDLSQPKSRADLARHIAAIANFGGGAIVFGIDNKGHSCGPAPTTFKVDHDLIASITRKYLEPAVHCDVRWVQSTNGVLHAVVQIPPHGATPICAKANGPDTKGKIEGIVSGVHYLRKPGPESSPITLASEWRDVIRRCALHDRTAILTAISAALSDSAAGRTTAPDDRLKRWVEAAEHHYIDQIQGRSFAAPLEECRIQLSYRIETEDGQSLPATGLAHVLREVAADVDEYVNSGWSLFYVFSGDSMAPRWKSDPSYGDTEFLETDLIDSARTLGFDLWRIAPEGLATVIREYWEDTPDFQLPPRTKLNPRILTRTLGELIRHAEAFGRRFALPLRVEFICRWQGLNGRQLFVPNGVPFRNRPATTDIVVTSGVWPYADLGAKTPIITEALSGKVARALDWEGLTAAVIEQEMPTWRRS